MTTVFPGAVDEFTRPTTGGSRSAGRKETEIIDDLADGIEAVQTELGINPSGSAISVAARLDYVDALLLERLAEVDQFANLAAFPVTGVAGRIYIAEDTGQPYRWGGSAYVTIGGGSGPEMVGSFAAARGLSSAPTKPVWITTRSAFGDAGGGVFDWDAASTVADNDGTILKLTAVATGRLVRRVDGNSVAAEWWGAKGDGTTDDTTAFQAAVGAGLVEPRAKTYAIDGTIVMGLRTSMTLTAGATLLRRAAATSTEPIIRMSYQFASLRGDGVIKSDKPSPNGVVRIGHANGSDITPILWNQIEGVTINGDWSVGSIGLLMSSNEVTVPGATNYANVVKNIHIKFVQFGIRCPELSNAHSISNVNFYQIRAGDGSEGVCYDFIGALENNVTGGFTHFSANAQIIRLRAGTTYGSLANTFVGVLAEPGGANARYYDIGAGCNGNTIIGVQNCNQGPIDNGTDNGGSISGVRFGNRQLDQAGSTLTQVYNHQNFTQNTVTIGNIKLTTATEFRGGATYTIEARGFSGGGYAPFYGKWTVMTWNATTSTPALKIVGADSMRCKLVKTSETSVRLELPTWAAPFGDCYVTVVKSGANTPDVTFTPGSGTITSESGPEARNQATWIYKPTHGFATGDIVRHNGTNWVKAQSNSAANCVGIAVAASQTTSEFDVLVSGLVGGFTGLTAGTTYYVSPTTAGTLTSTDPGVVGSRVGVAIDAEHIMFRPQN